jgi:hypothetical protein
VRSRVVLLAEGAIVTATKYRLPSGKSKVPITEDVVPTNWISLLYLRTYMGLPVPAASSSRPAP